jgi:cell division protein FtsX
LELNKVRRQAELDVFFDANFVLTEFIRNGTVTTVTGANVGAFLAQITNNYRSLRSQIANASTLTALNAININSGWPANP